MSRAERVIAELNAPDRYGVLLALIVVAVLVAAAVADEPWGKIAFITLVGLILLFALRTSRASRLFTRVTAGLVAAGIALTVAGELGRPTPILSGLAQAANALLLALMPLVIGRRLLSHADVNASTVFGALCVYLVLGLLFASLYELVDKVTATRFFTTVSRPTSVDFVYFSYVTLATVGYGDLVPGGNLGRMTAAVEGLIGQLYLVTVVAVIVSRFRGRGARASRGAGRGTSRIRRSGRARPPRRSRRA